VPDPVPGPLIVSVPVPVPVPVPFNILIVSVPTAVVSDDPEALPELLQLNDVNAIITMNNTRFIIFIFYD